MLAALCTLITKNAYLRFYPRYLIWIENHRIYITALLFLLGPALTWASLTRLFFMSRDYSIMLLLVGLAIAFGSPVMSKVIISFAKEAAADEETLERDYVLTSLFAGGIGLFFIIVGILHRIHEH